MEKGCVTVVLLPRIPAGNPLRPGHPASYEGSAQPCRWLPPCSQRELRRGLDHTWPSPGPGSTPDMPRQPARHSTGVSACWWVGPPCPLQYLPPSHRHLPASGRRLAPSPSSSLPACRGSKCSVSSLGRGAVVACPHGGTRSWSSCAVVLPVAACGAPVGRRRQCGMEVAVSTQRPPQCPCPLRCQGSSWPRQSG